MKNIVKKGRKGKNSITAVSAVLGFGIVCAIPAMLSLEGNKLGYTNSVTAFLLWLSVSFLMNHILKHDFQGKKSRWLIPGMFAFLFSVCMVFGTNLDTKESVPFTDISLWLSIFMLTIGFALTVRFFWDALQNKMQEEKLKTKQTAEKKEQKPEQTGQRASFFLTAGIILLCYLPVFLAVYPGFFVYDAQDELMQVVTRSFSTHHPLLHVLLLGGIIQLIHKLGGSYNLGIACYTLFQMTVLSGIFSFCIGRLKKEGLPKAGRILLTLYFGLFPVIVMFSLCSAKDGLFTGMLLIIVLMLREFFKEPREFWKKKGHVILLAAASLLMMLLRHNGFYGFLVFGVVCLFLSKLTGAFKHGRKALFLFAGIIAGYLLLNQGLALVLHADSSENQELLTVPIQQLARVYHDTEGSLSEEDKNTLYEILPKEALNRYVPKVSDGVKIDFNNEAYSQNPGKYRRLWLKWGLAHPFTYLNAWFMTSYGFWYPDTVIDVYRGNSVFTFTYGDSSYFGFEVEQPGERQSLLPLLEECYRQMSLEIAQQRIPVLSMLFSPGFLFWVMLFILGFFWYVGDYKRLSPYLLPLLLWLTVILGPTYLVRYVVFLWVLLPLLFWDLRDLIIKGNCDILTHG